MRIFWDELNRCARYDQRTYDCSAAGIADEEHFTRFEFAVWNLVGRYIITSEAANYGNNLQKLTVVNVYRAAASGSLISRSTLSPAPVNPASVAHCSVWAFARSDHMAGTVRIYSTGVLSTNSKVPKDFTRVSVSPNR